jgi:ribosomal peptide maturation radical SAM protein 1
MEKVALINPPWSSVRAGSLALGILKRCLEREDIESNIFHFNLRFARMIGISVNEKVSNTHLVGEWLFAWTLFGDRGTGELKNSYQDILREHRWLDGILEGIVPNLSPRAREAFFTRAAHEIIPAFLNDCMESVPWEDYKIVGFSTTFSQNVPALALARLIKQRYPDKKIVFGGSNVEGPMGVGLINAFDCIDYVVSGEGEERFPQLARNILGGDGRTPIPGISMRINGDVFPFKAPPPLIDLAKSSPVPDYHEYFDELKQLGLSKRIVPKILFESARGCWWGQKAHCTFCGINDEVMRFRSKPAQMVLDEITTLASEYKTNNFEAVDYILDYNYYKTLLPKLKRRNWDVFFFYEMKANVTREQVQLLHDAGMRWVQPGIESLNSELLQLMRKGVSAIQNIQLLKWCNEYGIKVTWNQLYAIPGEKPRHFQSVLQAMKLITHLEPPDAVVPIQLQRFSPYFTDGPSFGIVNVKPSPYYDLIFPADRVNLKEVAYYFDFKIIGLEGDPEEYITPVREFIERWRESFAAQKTFLVYAKGPGFLTVFDSRALSAGDNGAGVRKYVLRGLLKKIHIFCDQARYFDAILQHVNKARKANPLANVEVQAALDELVKIGLLFREGNRYLTLATPIKPWMRETNLGMLFRF